MKKIISNILLTLAIITLLASIFLFYQNKNKGNVYVFGYKPYIIISGSMEPYLQINSLVIVKKVNFKNIKVGDVISFNTDNIKTSICHRVIKITNEGLVTKGDNSKVADLTIITEKEFNGKVVFKTNIFAYLINRTKEKGVFLVIILPVIAITTFIITVKMLRKQKKKHL
jgi:signal peptidase I, archaeal type